MSENLPQGGGGNLAKGGGGGGGGVKRERGLKRGNMVIHINKQPHNPNVVWEKRERVIGEGVGD